MNTFKKQCLICNKSNLHEFLNYEMPVFMGVVQNKNLFSTEKMIFEQCNNCKNIQIKNNIDLKLLYKNNHNIGLVGNIWVDHYKQFSKFIKKIIINKKIIEISDPSCKIAKLCKNFDEWCIIEPNPENNIILPNKVKIIKKFLTNDLTINSKYDVLIHSHFLEHVVNLHDFMKQSDKLLIDGGYLCFSIPNFDYLIQKNTCPSNILHFEHTFYLNKNIIQFILNSYGYKFVECKKFKNHSIFFKFIKTNKIKKNKVKIKSIKNKIIKNYNKSLVKIKKINKIINKYNKIYIFGAHVNTQFYIYNGLNTITGILDNSPHKENKFLYGTNYKVKNPNILKNKKNIAVICSHTGPYYKEIKNQLNAINKQVVIL